jgi:hypothetical protein
MSDNPKLAVDTNIVQESSKTEVNSNACTGPLKAIASGFLLEEVLCQSVPCHVLADGRRVLSQAGVWSALQGKNTEKNGWGKDAHFGQYFERLPEKYRPNSDGARIEFVPLHGGRVSFGVDAELFIDICTAYVRAMRENDLHHKQIHIAHSAQDLLMAFAKVGITALIDEATSYERQRERNALQNQMIKILRETRGEWHKTFEDSLVIALKALYKYEWTPGMRHPKGLRNLYGMLYDFILGSEIAAELREISNPDPNSKRHQWLEQYAREAFARQLPVVEALAKQSGSREEFIRRLRSNYQNVPFQTMLCAFN